MSFLARIFVDDQEREILNADYLFYKTKSLYGKPDSEALGGQLDIALESTANDNLWFDWMFSTELRKKGHIRFYNRDGLSKLFDFEFWDCYCTGLHESFRANGPMPMTLKLSLSPGIFRIRDYIYEKPWKISDPFSKNEAVTGRNEEDREVVEPSITEAFVNTSFLSPDNKCENCATIHVLGKNFLPTNGFQNGVEIQFMIADWPNSGEDNPYSLNITRMIVDGRITFQYENMMIPHTIKDKSDGPKTINLQLEPVRGKIYSIDGPGFPNTDIELWETSIIAVTQVGNFVETATLKRPGKDDINFSVNWHTRLEIRRDKHGIFQYDQEKGEIGRGHISI